MDLFQALVLAIVQGVTAWIPVSSKTQVILVGNALFSIPFKSALAFALVLHIGDLLAALYKYRKEYAGSLSMLPNPRKITVFFGVSEETLTQKFLVVSIFATAVVSLPVYLLVRGTFSDLSGEPLLFAVGCILILMAAFEVYSNKRKPRSSAITLRTSVLAGAAQGLAVIPGISRSGITQSSLLLLGLPADKAVRLSFLMSAPMIAASVLAFYFVEGFQGISIEAAVLGIAVSALVSFYTMDAITRIARNIPSYYFLVAVGLLAMVPFALKLVLGATE